MPDYAVSTLFKGKDNVSAIFDAMARAAGRYSNDAEKAFKKVRRESDETSSALRNAAKSGYKFGTVVKGILAANAIRSGLGLVTGGVRKVVGDFLEFDDTMVSAAAKFDDIGVKATDFGGKLKQLKADWRGFAMGTRFSAAEVAKSAEAFAEAGWDSKLARGVTPYLIKGATANREKDLAEFTNSITGIMQGFNLRTGDASKDAAGFRVVLDQITQGALDAIGGIKDLKESLKVLAPVWQESETTAATIAFASTLQNAGFPADMVATAGKNLKLRLARPDIAANLLANGVDIKDPKTGKVKSALQMYEMIDARMKKLGIKPGSPAEIAINTMLFGAWSVAGNKSMMQHLSAYRSEIERIQNQSHNVVQDTSAKMNEFSSTAKLLMLAGTVMDKGMTILERFNGAGQTGIMGLTEKIKNFNVTPLIDGLSLVGRTAGVMWDLISPILPALPFLVGGFLAWSGALKAAALGAKLITYWNIGAALTAGLGPVGAMTTALGALGAALLPVVTGFLAITAGASILSAGYSLFTGKDNPISLLAQHMGLVPTIAHNSSGRITGYAAAPEAPNVKDAQAKQLSFRGQLDIANAPPGSVFQPFGPNSPLTVNMLGANP